MREVSAAASGGLLPVVALASSLWLVMGTRRTTDVLPRLIRHLHVELDRRELLGGHAELAKEWQPAGVGVQGCKHRVNSYRTQREVVLLHRLVQPLERTIGGAAEREHHGDCECRSPIVFTDQFGKRGIRFGLHALCVANHRQYGQAILLVGL